jgi:negative regulator of sigma E activity
MDIVAPEQLPDGFSLQSINLMRFDDHKSVHLIYSDGLMVLSVFQSPSGDEDRRNEQRREHINIWKINVKGVELEVISDGNMLIPRWKHGDINLTLIGELDLTEMKKIAGAFIG